MKKLFFTLAAFVACYFASAQYCGNSGPGECTPISGPIFGSFTMSEITPCIEVGTAYDNAIQFTMPSVLNFQGQQQLDSMEIVAIDNLPCGMCWSLNKANNRYAANEDGCLRIQGTNNFLVGQYKLDIKLKIWINGQAAALSIPASLTDQMEIRLFLRTSLSVLMGCAIVDSSVTANNMQAGTCNTQIPVPNFDWVYYPYYPGNVVQFNDLSTNNPTSWIWSFGDGSGSTMQNPSKNYAILDTFIVCLTASNSAGTSAQVCKEVVANGNIALMAHSVADTVCANSNVIIDPLVFGGRRPYTYYWSATGDALSCSTCKTPEVAITQNSTYTLTVIDANNNSVTATHAYHINASINSMQVSVITTTVDCQHTTDTTTLLINGGTPPYKIAWGDQGFDTTINTSAIHSYFSQEGNFVIKVADSYNCIAAVSNNFLFNGITITALQTIQPPCQNDSAGKLKISATGGTAPYTYHWNNGSIADSITNISAGYYHITVTDATGCSFAKTFSVAPVNGWGYYVFVEPSSSNCNNNGSINTTVTGGNAPFSFLWSNNTTTEDLSGLTGGVYYVTVTDATGCIATGGAAVPTSCYSLIEGTIFSDNNNNCTYDVGENQIQNVFVTAVGGGQTYYGYADGNGNYSIQVPAFGSFTLGASSAYGYGTCGNLSLCNNANHTITLATIGDTSLNNNFGFTGSTGFDLNIHPGWRSANPGFEKDYWIYCGNNAVTNFNGTATVTFNYDENLIFQSADQGAIHNLATHTLTWDVTNIQSNSSFWDHQLHCTFMVPQTLLLGHLLHSSFRMEPTIGDCDSSNNKLFVSETVIGSLDPNEKKVEPAGDILEEDSVLTYEIGFQNTGTDSTHFIIIKDTLSPYLDPATVRNIASSHPYSDFSISGTGILTWTFNPLRLVDSFTNEPGSHGFVRFTIKKKKNLPLTTVISNTAHIYFDYNTAVVTNTVTNTLTEPNGIWHIRSTEGITVKAFPNPFSEGTSIVVDGLTGRFDFELYDITGKLNKRLTSIETNQFFINRDNLSAGIYFFKVLSADKKKSGYGKLVVE